MAFMISKVAERVLRESYSHCLHKLPELKPHAVEFRSKLRELITKNLTQLISTTRQVLAGELTVVEEVKLTGAVELLALREIGLRYESHAVYSVVGNVLARGKHYNVDAPEEMTDVGKRGVLRDEWEESRTVYVGTRERGSFVYDKEVSSELEKLVEGSCMEFYKDAVEELREVLKGVKVTSSDKRMVEYLSERASSGISVIQLIEDIAEDPIPVRIGDLEPKGANVLYVFDLDKTLANYYSRSLKPLSKKDLSSTKPTVELRKKFREISSSQPLLVLTARNSKDELEVREWIKKNLKVSEDQYDLVTKGETSLDSYMQTPEWKSKEVSKYIDSISCKTTLSHIVFYDDRLDNLVAVQSLAHSLGLGFTGYAMF